MGQPISSYLRLGLRKASPNVLKLMKIVVHTIDKAETHI